MDTNLTDDTIDQDLEVLDEDEGDCELLDHETDDEVSPGYEDKLSEAVLGRIHHFVPRHTLAVGEVHNGYLEVFTEHLALVNDHQIVDQVSVSLIADELAPRVQTLQGVLRSEFVGGNQLLEVGYRYSESNSEVGFLYVITLDGKWIKGFRSSALALLTFDVLVDHKVSRFDDFIQRVTAIFHSRGVQRGEDLREVCTDEFAEEVYYLVNQ